LESVFTNLVGLKPEHLSRKSGANDGPGKGIFGTAKAYFGVIETQGRGSLHIHIAVWSSIPASFLQKVSHIDELAQAIAKVWNSICAAQIPTDVHLDGLERRIEGGHAVRFGLDSSPVPKDPVSKEAYEERVSQVIDAVNNHHCHNSTCHKGKVGKIKCRLCMPRTLKSETGPVQLAIIERKVLVSDVTDPPEVDLVEGEPFLPEDHRMIYWELQRPDIRGQIPADLLESKPKKMLEPSNGNIVEYSPALSAALGCNTCVSPLGDLVLAKSVIFYMIKYMTKDPIALANTLSCIVSAAKHIALYPSAAEDSGTATRSAKHAITRALNNITGQGEYSQSLCAAVLLGHKSSIASHATTMLFKKSAQSFLNEHNELWVPNEPSGKND
jgi:hypothetical protein